MEMYTEVIDPENLPTSVIEVIGQHEQRTYHGGNGHHCFRGDNGVLYKTAAYSAFIGLHKLTLGKRLRDYPMDREGILLKDMPTSHDGFYNKIKSIEWNTSKCRRNHINCINYSECQSKRLCIQGYAKWVEPNNTDECYVAPTLSWHQLKAINMGATP